MNLLTIYGSEGKASLFVLQDRCMLSCLACLFTKILCSAKMAERVLLRGFFLEFLGVEGASPTLVAPAPATSNH